MSYQNEILTPQLQSAPQTISGVIESHATRYPKRPALVGSEFAPFTFQDLGLHIKQIGKQLGAAGIGSLSRVGIVLPRCPEAAVLGVSIASHTTSVPLNPTLTAMEFEEEVRRVSLDAVVLPSWQESSAGAAARNSSLGIFQVSKCTNGLGDVALQQIRQIPRARQKSSVSSPQSAAIILRTSGTTGAVKLVPVTHQNLIEMANKMRRWFSLSFEDRCACILPTYYAAGLKTTLLAPLLLGESVALPATNHPENLSEWISDLRPTWFSATPSVLLAILDRLSELPEKLEHSLRFVLSSSAYLPEAVRTELEAALGVPVLEFYGLSEAGIMAANPAPPAKRKPGTAGLVPRSELAIKDQDETLLPDGKIGEIVVRGPSVTPAYINEFGSSGTGLKNGWLATGDLGFVDSEGFLTIVGRIKELINRGGEKVSPYDVEKALLLHPSVQDAAAFSIPHPRLGENVAAAVVLRPGIHATPSELREFLYGQLAHFKVPQQVFILPSLPRGKTNKILRSQLSEMVAQHIRQPTPPEGLLELQISEIWQSLLGRTDIGVEDDFFEAGGDSLQATEMILNVEIVTRQRIPKSELRSAYTIRQLAAAVARATPPRVELVTCAKEGSGRPFFFCHGDYLTHGFYALALADLLENDQAVYLLHPYRPRDIVASSTIEDMARSYIPHLLAAQPRGAFRLGGYCNGGLLAWELAHQLGKVGREVEFVVLVDTMSLNARLTLRAIEAMLRLVTRVSPKHIGKKIRSEAMNTLWWQIRRIWADRRIARRAIRLIRRAMSNIFRRSAPRQLAGNKSTFWGADYHRIMSNYIPPKTNSAIFCVLSEESRNNINMLPSSWTNLTPNVHTKYVLGGHASCITTHLSDLASSLNSVLASGLAVKLGPGR